MNNAIDFLMNTEDNSSRESSSDEDDHNLVMFSLTEKANAETDIESYACDDNEWWSCTPCAKELINVTQVCLTKKINRNLPTPLPPMQHTPQIRNQEKRLKEAGKKALTCIQL